MMRSARATRLALALVCLAVGNALGAEKNGSAILPGGDSKKPINIEAAKLDYFDKERKLVYTGNVVAVQGDSKLKATTLTIFLAPKKTGETSSGGGGSTNQVQRMYATGPVTLLQKDQIGTGDNCTYDKAQNLVVMTGNVTLSQGPNVTKGDRLEYDTKSGQAKVTGKHVSSMFIPENSNDTAQPAAATDAPPTRKAPKPRTKRSSSE